MTRIEEVYASLLPELAQNNIPDTAEHRLWALEGLLSGWNEDDEDLPFDQRAEKGLYVLAVTLEIMMLKLKGAA